MTEFRFYSAEDSREVRKVYFEALRKQKNPPKRKFLITKKEWDEFLKQGRDMTRYEVYTDFLKRMRKQIALEAYGTYLENIKKTFGPNSEEAKRALAKAPKPTNYEP